DPDAGDAGLVSDLIAFCGYPGASSVLSEIAARRKPEEASALLATAARLSLADGFRPEALGFAEQALALTPGLAGLLDTVELAAGVDESERLNRAYQRVFDALLGRYGERALSYRAARELQRRSDVESSLQWSV